MSHLDSKRTKTPRLCRVWKHGDLAVRKLRRGGCRKASLGIVALLLVRRVVESALGTASEVTDLTAVPADPQT